jgi:hypothetical protein
MAMDKHNGHFERGHGHGHRISPAGATVEVAARKIAEIIWLAVEAA